MKLKFSFSSNHFAIHIKYSSPPLEQPTQLAKSGEAIAQLMLGADLALLNKDQATFCPVHRPEHCATIDLVLESLDLASSVLK